MHIEVEIQGVTPLLCNRFGEENEVAVSSGTSSAIKAGGRALPRDDAEARLYKDKKGAAYIPGPNILSCITAAGKFHKVGKSKVTTQKSSLVTAAMSVDDLVCKIKGDWEVDSRSVRIPATGGRIMRHRPRFDKWSLKFHVEIDTEMFSETFTRQLIDDAGKKIGLGDFRPDCKGPFGKFVVKNWKQMKMAA